MIKKIILVVFLSVLFVFNANAEGGNDIKNEYWNWDNGMPHALVFENYFFADDGTFRYSWGFSGDKYSGGWYGGTYFYDAVKNKIFFNTTANGTMGASENMERPAPKDLQIHEFIGSGTVKIDIEAEHAKDHHQLFDGIMERQQGRIKEQIWSLMNYATNFEICFDPQGNCLIRESKRDGEMLSQYECSYSISGGILFLEVKSALVKNINTKEKENVQYDPAAKTYIRLGVKNGNGIQVENVKIDGILGGSRNWDYSDGKYIVKNKLPKVKQKDFHTYKIEKQSGGNITSLAETDGQEVSIY